MRWPLIVGLLLVVGGTGLDAWAQSPPPYLRAATFYVSVDDWLDISLNGVPVVWSQSYTGIDRGPNKIFGVLRTLCSFKNENILAFELDDSRNPPDATQDYVGFAYVLELVFSDGTRQLLTSNEVDQHKAYFVRDYAQGNPRGWQEYQFDDSSWGPAYATGTTIPGLAALNIQNFGGPFTFLSAFSNSYRAQRPGEKHLFRRKFFLNVSSNPDCLRPMARNRAQHRSLFKPSSFLKVRVSPTIRVVLKPTPTAAIDRIAPLLVHQSDKHYQVPLSTPMGDQDQEPGGPVSPNLEPTFSVTPTAVFQDAPLSTPEPSLTKNPAPLFTMTPSSNAGQTIVFGAPPANIYVSFADGPGVYRLEVLDKSGNHWKTFFEKKVVAQGEDWAEWDGKNDSGREAPAGEYCVIFSRNDKELKRITLIKTVGN